MGMLVKLRDQVPTMCIDFGRMASQCVGVMRWQREPLATGDGAFGGWSIHRKVAWRYRFPPHSHTSACSMAMWALARQGFRLS
jgi:hypothetical protein